MIYFPKQNLENMSEIISSEAFFPTIVLSSSNACLSGIATKSIGALVFVAFFASSMLNIAFSIKSLCLILVIKFPSSMSISLKENSLFLLYF